MTNHIISKRRLKPFKQFLPEVFGTDNGKHWGKH